jgi:phospholipid transport system substrate-binding protein
MMNTRLSRRLFLGLTAGALALAGRPAFADMDPAAQRIQSFYDVLLDSMKQAKTLGIQGRYDKLAPAVQAAFDIPGVAKLACGSAWAKIPADQQTAIATAFGRFVAARYANEFHDYSGEKFTVDPNPLARNADKVVRSQLVPVSDDPTSFDYLMRGSGADWRIEDVYLDGSISQLAVWRSEFSAVLSSGGPDALLAKIKSLGDQLLTGK